MSRVNKRLDAAGGQTKAPKSVWPTRALGDVCDVIGGGTPSKEIASYYGGAIPWATVRDMKTDLIENTECSITTDAVQASATNIIPAGNVIIATRVGLGKVCILGQDTAINQDLRGIIPRNGNVKVKFLYHWLRYIAPRIVAEGSGATVQGVKLPFIKSLQMPLPTIPEQDRIVAILDEAFEGIGTAKAIIERSRANARRLFESKLQSLIGSPTENWPRTNFGEQTDISTGFPFKSQGYTASDDSMKLLRGDNIIQGQLRWEDVKKWPIADTEEYKDYELREGDVVLAMDRTWVKAGIKYAVLSSEDVPCLLVQRTARLRARKTLHPKFLRWLIGSERFTEYVLSVQTGSGVPHISGPQIKAFKFQLPSMKDQLLISSILDDLLAETNRLDGVYSQKLSALDELKQSFLQSAFSKEL